MKYHLLLSLPPRAFPEYLDFSVKSAMKALNVEMTSTLKKLLKKEHGQHCSTLFHLYSEDSMEQLKKQLKEHDEILIHGEGYPFLIGPTELGPYTITAKELAMRLYVANTPDLHIHIKLLTCNSATMYEGSNFARDVSRALTFCFHYNNVSVSGYTGFIEVKSNAKYTVTSSLSGRLSKGEHASLDDAVQTYKNGILLHTGGTVLIKSLSSVGSSWAGFFIQKTMNERREVTRIESNDYEVCNAVAASV